MKKLMPSLGSANRVVEAGEAVAEAVGPVLEAAGPKLATAAAIAAHAHPAIAATVAVGAAGVRLAHLKKEAKETINNDPGKYIGLNTTILLALLNELQEAKSLIAYPTEDVEALQRRKNVLSYLHGQMREVYGDDIPVINTEALTTARQEITNSTKLMARQPPEHMRGGRRRRPRTQKRKKKTKKTKKRSKAKRSKAKRSRAK